MIDHVTTRVSDAVASERFYDLVFESLGVTKYSGGFGEGCPEYGDWGDLSIAPADGPPTTGLHIAFGVDSPEDVDRFWQTTVDAGYRSDGEPGLRTQYLPDYYGAFVLDPDGNSVEAVHHSGVRGGGMLDHMWIGVPDLDAAVAFYDTIAPYSRYPRFIEADGRVHFGAMGSHFAFVTDGRAPIQNLHLAFGTDSNQVVDDFHSAAVAAGYRDNGGPGERLEYHPGYYGAFVFDPAGINVEVVNHNR